MRVRRYRVSRAAAVARDFGLIEEYLFQAYQGFGDDVETAQARAAARIEEALGYMRSFAAHPHRGTEHAAICAGLHSVTAKNFIFYFEIDEPADVVRILAVFFGGADHRRQIIERLRE